MKNKNIIISVVVCLLPILLGIAVYNEMPEQMPIHFTINDIPDNYASKNFALFGIPVIMTLVQLIVCLSVKKTTKDEAQPKLIKILQWMIPIITATIYVIMIMYSLGNNVYIGKSVCFIIGIMFIILGNYSPKMKYEVGKTMINPRPKDEKSFRKMTRIMGYSFVIMGIVLLILMLFV